MMDGHWAEDGQGEQGLVVRHSRRSDRDWDAVHAGGRCMQSVLTRNKFRTIRSSNLLYGDRTVLVASGDRRV